MMIIPATFIRLGFGSSWFPIVNRRGKVTTALASLSFFSTSTNCSPSRMKTLANEDVAYETAWRSSDLRKIPGITPQSERLFLLGGLGTIHLVLEKFCSNSMSRNKEKFASFLSDTVGIRCSKETKLIASYISQREMDLRSQVGLHGTKTRRLTFCVEGNISSGKTTFLQQIIAGDLRLQDIVEVVPEPVAKWQDCRSNSSVDRASSSNMSEDTNILDAFYKDPVKHAYAFQTYVFITRMMQSYNSVIGEKPLRIMERSVFCDRLVFVRAMFETKCFTPLEMNLYESWFDPVVSQVPGVIPDAFIYLRAEPETCHERLKIRSRSEEAGVSLEYLTKLHENHESWLAPNTTHDNCDILSESVLHVPIPDILKGCVRFIDGSKSHICVDALPVLIVDCNEYIEYAANRDSEGNIHTTSNDHDDDDSGNKYRCASVSKYAEQIEAFYEYVNDLHKYKTSNLHIHNLSLFDENQNMMGVTNALRNNLVMDGTMEIPPKTQRMNAILQPSSIETRTMMAVFAAEASRRGFSHDSAGFFSKFMSAKKYQ